MTEEQALTAVRPLLTPAFFLTLREAARIYGDLGDSIAVRDFVQWCHAVAKAHCPDLTPYVFSDDQAP